MAAKLIRSNEEAIDCLRKNKPTSGYQMLQESVDMAIDALKNTEWIKVSDKLPKPEEEVLVLTESKIGNRKITTALYEDGTILENESIWYWIDCDFEKYNEEEECYVIDEGWWENRHYNTDNVYNNAIDDEVIAWMPLPSKDNI